MERGPSSGAAGRKAWALYALVLGLVIVATAVAIWWNAEYLDDLPGLPAALASIRYTPVAFGGLGGAILGAAQILLLGTVLVRLLLPRTTGSLAGKVLAAGMGLGGVAALVSPLALVGAFNLATLEGSVLGTIAVAAVLSWRLNRVRPREWLASLLDLWRFRAPRLTKVEILVVGAIAAVLVLLAYDTIFYPVSETDALIYHAPLAVLAYERGGVPWTAAGGVGLSSSANYPQAYSLLGASFYLWSGGVNDGYLRLLGWAAGLLSVLGTYLIGREMGDRRTGLLAAFLVVAVPAYASYMTLATQMTSLVMFGAFGFYAYLRATTEKSYRWAAAAGFLLGAACLTSYQGLYLAVPLAAAFLLHLIGSRSLRDRVVRLDGLAVVVAAAVGAAPYLRNALLLGNPVYPFLNGLFHSPYVSSRMLALNDLEWQGVARILLYMDPNDSSWLSLVGHFSISPALLPLNVAIAVPFLALLPWSGLRRWRHLVLFFAVVLACILAGPILFVRYEWLLLPFMAPAVAGGVLAALRRIPPAEDVRPAHRLARQGATAAPVLVLAVLLVLPIMVGFGGNAYSFVYQRPPDSLFQYFVRPGEDPWQVLYDQYGTDVLGWQWLNANLRPGDRIASLEIRVYYLAPVLRDPHVMLYLDSQEAEPLLDLADPAAVVAFLEGHGATYVFVRVLDWKGVYAHDMPLFRLLASAEFPVVFSAGETLVYHVGPIPGPGTQVQASADVRVRGGNVGIVGGS